MSTTATGASPCSSAARVALNTSISKNAGWSAPSLRIERNLEIVSLCIATNKISSLPSAVLGPLEPPDITNQSRLTSLMGTGIYLRASIGTADASVFSTAAGSLITDTKDDEY